MHSYHVRTDYDVLYDATRAEAEKWSPARLTITLSLMLSKKPVDEARWGAVDAISDLLGRITPPVWRQGM